MHRRRLKALLAAYRRRWPQESATVARFDAFVDSRPDCFHRSCRVGHITGSAWLVDTTGERTRALAYRTSHAKSVIISPRVNRKAVRAFKVKTSTGSEA